MMGDQELVSFMGSTRNLRAAYLVMKVETEATGKQNRTKPKSFWRFQGV